MLWLNVCTTRGIRSYARAVGSGDYPYPSNYLRLRTRPARFGIQQQPIAIEHNRAHPHRHVPNAPIIRRPLRLVARTLVSSTTVIVWINGTHGSGKTTTSAIVQTQISNSRVFDAEKVGETLMDITPGLPATNNFQHWPPWRALVVETARHVLAYTGGTLIMPMTVLIEQYWREISSGIAEHQIPLRHFVLHADQATLRKRIQGDTAMGPSTFRLNYLDAYAEATNSWLHDQAQVIDTTRTDAHQAAKAISDAVNG